MNVLKQKSKPVTDIASQQEKQEKQRLEDVIEQLKSKLQDIR